MQPYPLLNYSNLLKTSWNALLWTVNCPITFFLYWLQELRWRGSLQRAWIFEIQTTHQVFQKFYIIQVEASWIGVSIYSSTRTTRVIFETRFWITRRYLECSVVLEMSAYTPWSCCSSSLVEKALEYWSTCSISRFVPGLDPGAEQA